MTIIIILYGADTRNRYPITRTLRRHFLIHIDKADSNRVLGAVFVKAVYDYGGIRISDLSCMF